MVVHSCMGSGSLTGTVKEQQVPSTTGTQGLNHLGGMGGTPPPFVTCQVPLEGTRRQMPGTTRVSLE